MINDLMARPLREKLFLLLPLPGKRICQCGWTDGWSGGWVGGLVGGLVCGWVGGWVCCSLEAAGFA